ncbi:lipase [Ligilactobacillus salivarius]|uniref:SGNH/GDSL hydrolase family protein n=1 Tax=Ligilactobacillus salivarius TaxID=1624 RepID=UPI002551CC36|nr:SGNH/GDSL hydrolase family protein [Ligilactobacillus salivarius]MDL1929950.1 lipase [Ligilactobacillus salivarius]
MNYKKIVLLWSLVAILIGAITLTTINSKKNISKSNEVQLKRTRKNVKAVKVSKIKLVGLGDSLTYGVGDQTNKGGYVHLIKEKIEKKESIKVVTKNYGKTGDRSDQILARLLTKKNIQKDIKNANVITMTVGGNDLMQVMEKNFSSMADDKMQPVVEKSAKNYQSNLQNLIGKVTLEENKVYFIDINKQLSMGQYVNLPKEDLVKKSETDLDKKSGKQLENILSNTKEKNDYLSEDDHFHPNLKGYKYMTNKLFDEMNRHKNTWLVK